jgi:hypothetical protein
LHRSPLPLLVILAAAVACSTQGSSERDENELLSRDSTLVARLGSDQKSNALSLPAACGIVARAPSPSVASQRRAEDLTRQALDAEIHGNIGAARSLLRTASDLDATNTSAAYHLGRTSEELHDSTAAMRAFCRYLALRPTPAESAEASMRVARLAPRATLAATLAPTPPATSSVQRATGQRVAVTGRSSRSSGTVVRTRGVQTTRAPQQAHRVATDGTSSSPAASRSVAGAPAADASVHATAGGEVVPTSPPASDGDPSPSAPSTARRGPSATQGAVIGAASGAIIGAVTGRSVKSAVIGAAAGGLLGTVVVRARQPRRWSQR